MCWPSTDPGRHVALRLDARHYTRHALHGEDRAWPETNCYTDLMVELAHAQGYDPVAMLPFTLAADFEGDQWTFFKPAACELWDLYGFDVQELAIARPVVEHVAEQVERGNVVLVEVDSHFLPDTAGTAYKTEHAKTTIGVNDIDVDRARLGYFHNAGYFWLEGDDFHALFPAQPPPRERQLPPYVEFVKPRRDFRPPRGAALVGRSLEMARRHAERIPRENPFPAFRARFERDLEGLLCKRLCFHDYSFATLRQFGANYELAATWLDWLGANGISGFEENAASLKAISDGAKAFQFQLARSVARSRPLDAAPLDEMGAHWECGIAPLRKRFA